MAVIQVGQDMSRKIEEDGVFRIFKGGQILWNVIQAGIGAKVVLVRGYYEYTH
jgi:hypothetical protein